MGDVAVALGCYCRRAFCRPIHTLSHTSLLGRAACGSPRDMRETKSVVWRVLLSPSNYKRAESEYSSIVHIPSLELLRSLPSLEVMIISTIIEITAHSAPPAGFMGSEEARKSL